MTQERASLPANPVLNEALLDRIQLERYDRTGSDESRGEYRREPLNGRVPAAVFASSSSPSAFAAQRLELERSVVGRHHQSQSTGPTRAHLPHRVKLFDPRDGLGILIPREKTAPKHADV